MLNIAVLVSGGGTNLQALLDSEARGENPNGKIRLVVASKPGVYALERAANAGVEGVVVRRKDYASSEDFDAALLKTLKEHHRVRRSLLSCWDVNFHSFAYDPTDTFRVEYRGYR